MYNCHSVTIHLNNFDQTKVIMKISKTLSGFLLLTFSLISSCGGGAKDQEGKSIRSIKLGNQIWMAENLDVSHFRNGDTIPEVRSSLEWNKMGEEGNPAWCFIQNDPEKEKKFGKLYNWYAVNDPRGLAPKNWHVASDDEWTQLINFLGGGVMAALKMRTTGLTDNLNSSKEDGFAGLAGGCRNSSGTFYGNDSFGYWWAATEFGTSSAFIRVLNYVSCDINFQTLEKTYGVSVRCLSD
jgi:uncharacterized protein (TIGR02145 family)